MVVASPARNILARFNRICDDLAGFSEIKTIANRSVQAIDIWQVTLEAKYLVETVSLACGLWVNAQCIQVILYNGNGALPCKRGV